MRYVFVAGLMGLGFLVSSAVGPAFAADDSDAGKATNGKPSGDAKTLTLKPERLKLELSLSGQFASDQSAEIAIRPEAWSKLEVRQAVAHGTAVQAGATLIELELSDLQRAVVEAEHTLRLAQLSLATAEVNLDALRKTTPIELQVAERGAKQAEQDLDYFLEVTRPQSEKSAHESLERYAFSLEYANEELNQLRQMYEEDDLTEETEEIILKRAERGVEQAMSSLESAEIRTARTLEVELPRREEDMQATTAKQLANARKTVTALESGLQQAEIAFQKSQIAVAMAERKRTELQADLKTLSRIASPIDGFVYYGQVDDGTWSGKEKAQSYLKAGGTIPARAVVMTVVAPKVTHLRSTVAEKDLRELRQGMAAAVHPTVDPDDEIAVTLESLSRIPVSAGQFEVVFRVAESVDGVVEGMGGKAIVVTYDRADAILVPKSAVFDDGDEPYVFVTTDAGPERRAVKTGREKGQRTEIVAGLSAGDTILLSKPKGD